MLRAVGATRRQIRKVFGRETWLLALTLAALVMGGSAVHAMAAQGGKAEAKAVTCPPKPGPGIMLEFLTKEDGIWPGKDEHQNRL